MDIKLPHIIKSLGLIIFAVILLNIDYTTVFSILKMINIKYLVGGFVLIILIIVVKSYRWLLITRSLKLKETNFLKCFYLYNIGIYFGNISPGKLGELFKAVYIKNKENSMLRSFVSTIIDRIYDLLTLIIIGYLSLFLISKSFEGYFNLLTIIIVISTIIGIILILFWKKILKLSYRFILPKKIKNKSKETFKELINSIKLIKPTDYIVQLVLTLIGWILYFIMIYVLAVSINIDISFYYLAASIAITSLITLIPISFNGLGTRDATLLILFSQIGINKETTVAFSLLIFLINLIMGLPGLILFLRKKLKTQH
ncbi:flippase-like domain-containing protein [Candidatus Woesearchaeota archaeon]|jgi:glycosyltransferase 2 family protein|nr:flippase-like domain-containing protein [Candidatus Woesearchaeota archaeon]MBT5273094.1 flippase-like domain-containing protein [Candidatus Woesearchaeota archaeon]MBT6040858.1 flippase-like domain-containing protein [Candidatus Woesearchaeota archaeon]MBT6337591.1 flippase-like domain-containing protein [Candidatus Woesearchaeota archaeon]MBT7927008.1 flippase-like domain-containing protein [Candidatus Woesearchaeota archaeon]